MFLLALYSLQGQKAALFIKQSKDKGKRNTHMTVEARYDDFRFACFMNTIKKNQLTRIKVLSLGTKSDIHIFCPLSPEAASDFNPSSKL